MRTVVFVTTANIPFSWIVDEDCAVAGVSASGSATLTKTPAASIDNLVDFSCIFAGVTQLVGLNHRLYKNETVFLSSTATGVLNLFLAEIPADLAELP